MLLFDPEKRITIDEALEHPYMERLHFAEDEPTGDRVADFVFSELAKLDETNYFRLCLSSLLLSLIEDCDSFSRRTPSDV